MTVRTSQGRSLFKLMMNVWEKDHVNSVEALPHKRESGMSMVELVFGCERFLAGRPSDLVRECEDARQFCDRVESHVTNLFYIVTSPPLC